MPATRTSVIGFFFFLLLASQVLHRLSLLQQGRNIIDGDGKGYYGYLVQWSDYHNLKWQRPEWNNRAQLPHYIAEVNGNRYHKYASGTAFCMLPGFVVARTWQIITHHPRDLHGNAFQMAMLLNGIVFLLAGLWFVYRTLLLLEINKEQSTLTVIALTAASPLLFYAVHEPAMSHIYSFACISGCVFFILYFFNSGRELYLYVSVFLFCLAICIRPFHLLLIFILPWLIGNANSKSLNKITFSISSLLFSIVPLLVLFFTNKIQSGMWWPPQYPDEGFYFDQPQIVALLFGFRKGMFIWFPMTVLAITGWIHKKHFALFPWFLITIYVLSCWWNWYYGDSFGLRPMCDYFVFFFIGFAVFVQRITNYNKLKIPFYGLIFLGIAMNILLMYQYLTGIIPPDGMTAEKARFVAGKIAPRYAGLVHGEPQDIFGYPEKPVFTSLDTTTVTFSSAVEYGTVYDYQVSEDIHDGSRYLASARCQYKEGKANEALFTLTFFGKDNEVIFWDQGSITPLPRVAGHWYEASYSCILPREIPAGTKIRFVIWNKGKQEFMQRNMVCTLQKYALTK